MVVPPLLMLGVSGDLHHCSCPYLLPSKARAVPANASFVAAPRKGGAKKDLRIGPVETVLRREGKCHRPNATRVAQPPPSGHYSGREMPSFFIFFCKVQRFI